MPVLVAGCPPQPGPEPEPPLPQEDPDEPLDAPGGGETGDLEDDDDGA
jgi:hypothetical protein